MQARVAHSSDAPRVAVGVAPGSLWRRRRGGTSEPPALEIRFVVLVQGLRVWGLGLCLDSLSFQVLF